ncbi:MAG: hypothetical protein COW72_03405 [Candidatus Nealsonbacteria bacterium CG18_big_fil_WC_8_21_14_2_50_37_10]|uniref:Uncharacterized protein n=1 Tax=Candidatus Nealsonbacteria bacterium CG18_big_fil_WC_8_21_14_2_50_37_10 TaxID=1974717 RepID=A0A2H0FF16_9BACT|nr:MAG: hypothetical protein COW72_03405 [Candidatus Nealsonbacteria bacterium CG18_big_fil_WC_8_21_14_2_50_37_10]
MVQFKSGKSMIGEYHFGSITIDGKTYEYDVEVRWTGEVLEWWRGESHVIDIDDVKRAIDQNPELIIIGTGESGLAKVTERTKEEILSKGIGLIVDKTEEAVKTFNIQKEESTEEEGVQKKVIGLFHLTC